MSGKFPVKVLVALLVVLASSYLWRDKLSQLAATWLLADSPLSVTRIDGLQAGTRRSSVNELELLLGSGERLVADGLQVQYRFTSLTGAPALESIVIASAQLLPTPDGTAAVTAASTGNGATRLSDLLQLLREFPVQDIAITSLSLPQRSAAFALNLQGGAGMLNLQLASGDLQLDASFSQADATAAAALQADLRHSGASLGNITLTLQPLPSQTEYRLEGSGRLHIDDLNTLLDALEQAPLSFPLKAVNLDWDVQGNVSDDIGGALNGNTSSGATAPVFVVGMQAGSSLHLAAGAVPEMGDLALQFTDRAALNVSTGTEPLLTSGRLPLQINSNWQEQALDIAATLSLDNCHLRTSTACNITFDGDATVAGYQLGGVIAVAVPANAATAEPASYRVKTQALTLSGLPAWTPAFDVDATLVFDGDTLTFATPLVLRDAPADADIRIDGSYDLAGAAAVQLTLAPLAFNDTDRALSAWLRGWPYRVDLLTGSLAAQLALQWQPPDDAAAATFTGSFNSTLTELGGSYDDLYFLGINSELRGTIDTAAPFPLQTPPLALTIASVDVGVPLDNVAMHFRFDGEGQRLLVDSLSADVLGGSLGGKDQVYHFDSERNEITLNFTGLRLENMLALAEYEGVEATGAVSGTVPIVISPAGVEVTAGTLQADAPGGHIRYLTGAAGTQGNVGLDLVNQALGNYQFDALHSDINYSTDGELVLAMKMQGHNPDMNNGQRINLNLNLTDDVPALLQSLQATRAVEDFLERQYESASPQTPSR